jgi:hypothetical protein
MQTLGPDGQPLLRIDGPHAAPTQHVKEYDRRSTSNLALSLSLSVSLVLSLVVVVVVMFVVA